MDKFDSAADTGRSMLTGELTKTPVTSLTQDKSSRTLWAVSMCSLVAIGSLSAVLYADRTRIAQLENELASTHSILNRPEVMNRVLAMSQVSGSSSSSSSSSVSFSGSKSSNSSVDVDKSSTTVQYSSSNSNAGSNAAASASFQ